MSPLERQPSSRTCFVCGRDNHEGLRVRWFSDRSSGEVRADACVGERFNGFPGIVHGGIVASLLDEAMGRALLVTGGFDDLLVTARLEVLYRRPVPTGVPLAVSARLLHRSGRRAQTSAELRLPDGAVAAQAEALMARPPPEVSSAWEAERPHWRVDED